MTQKTRYFQTSCFCQIMAAFLLCCVSSSRSVAEDKAAKKKAHEASAKLLKTFVDEFVAITPGKNGMPRSFQMGSEHGSNAEQPVHTTTLGKNYSISRYEVYQNLYSDVMGNNPSRWHGPRNSAEQMTYSEAQDFCRRITQRLREAKLITQSQLIRLPTESEWEYCTRGGTTTPYSFGETAQRPNDQGKQATILNEYSWHTGNAAGNDPAVGILKPNPWGLYDVHGYLSEYCLGDWKENYSPETDSDKQKIAIRGGSWKDPYPLHTSSARRSFLKNGRDDAVGFRCVLVEESGKE